MSTFVVFLISYYIFAVGLQAEAVDSLYLVTGSRCEHRHRHNNYGRTIGDGGPMLGDDEDHLFGDEGRMHLDESPMFDTQLSREGDIYGRRITNVVEAAPHAQCAMSMKAMIKSSSSWMDELEASYSPDYGTYLEFNLLSVDMCNASDALYIYEAYGQRGDLTRFLGTLGRVTSPFLPSPPPRLRRGVPVRSTANNVTLLYITTNSCAGNKKGFHLHYKFVKYDVLPGDMDEGYRTTGPRCDKVSTASVIATVVGGALIFTALCVSCWVYSYCNRRRRGESDRVPIVM